MRAAEISDNPPNSAAFMPVLVSPAAFGSTVWQTVISPQAAGLLIFFTGGYYIIVVININYIFEKRVFACPLLTNSNLRFIFLSCLRVMPFRDRFGSLPGVKKKTKTRIKLSFKTS
ncbi:MAG: hypothetical protein OEU51_09855 [Gammaproteobacteria bacterium]|nr:hypothetical protein [Gammaproteobacteria bacterium]